jgi:exonuclease 3'-5' domain-containing protein 1
MMDEILSDGLMDKVEKMERLEAVLSAATSSLDHLAADSAEPSLCVCQCHQKEAPTNVSATTSPMTSLVVGGGGGEGGRMEVASQTLATGDIVITRIFFTEEEKEKERTLTPRGEE